jgi:hypothetical protein
MDHSGGMHGCRSGVDQIFGIRFGLGGVTRHPSTRAAQDAPPSPAALVEEVEVIAHLPGRLRRPQSAPHKGGFGLQENRQSSRVSAPAGPPQEHG